MKFVRRRPSLSAIACSSTVVGILTTFLRLRIGRADDLARDCDSNKPSFTAVLQIMLRDAVGVAVARCELRIQSQRTKPVPPWW